MECQKDRPASNIRRRKKNKVGAGFRCMCMFSQENGGECTPKCQKRTKT